MHLRTPVRAKPVRIASTTPKASTPVRIMGWGVTCEDSNNPECFPTRLREADTAVRPTATCSKATPGELCVGSRDGSVAASNMDSGGPALVHEDGQWAVAGVVSGPSGKGEPTLFTDVTQHADWINGIINGTHVPPDDQIPNVEGAISLDGCVGSVVRTPASRPEDPALMLTNGHCVRGQRPAPGNALVDQPANREAPIADRQGYPQATAHANRLVHATMTGTSGSALLAPDGTTVVGVHNTHNVGGKPCVTNNPCEVAEDGTVTSVRGRAYGQQVAPIASCLTEGSELDLSRPNCTLTGATPSSQGHGGRRR